MKPIKRFGALLIAAVTLLSGLAVGAQADTSQMTKEEVALVFGGSQITKGVGFLNNVAYLTQDALDEIQNSNNGSIAYKYGLGDSLLSSASLYSTYDNHGTAVWRYRRVYGFDLELLAEALGVDTSQPVTVAAVAKDDYTAALENAFDTGRYYINPQGELERVAKPVLALYDNSVISNDEPGAGSTVALPGAPTVGADSEDKIEPMFGYGQTDYLDHNGCKWVQYVNRIRFGTELPAVYIHTADEKTVTKPLSGMLLLGIYRTSFTYGSDTYDVSGVPLTELLEDLGVTVEAGEALRAVSSDGKAAEIAYSELGDCFLAWDATISGSAVTNNTALRLYTPDYELADLESLSVIDSDDPVPAYTFNDLEGYSWAQDAIYYLYDAEVVNGVGDGRFAPQQAISRGDFILMLYRAYKFEGATDDCFDDVATGKYYYEAIAIAKSLGIAKGDGSSFMPDEPITRQDAMTLILRTLDVVGIGIEGEADLEAFSDAGDIADYARDSIAKLVNAKVINGNDGKILPGDNMTRAEMAVALHRALINL